MNLDFLKDKTILVTGGTGSFGSSFVKFLLDNTKASKIIIFSRDELKQSRMRDALSDEERLRFFIGDVRDLQRLERAFNGVDIVVHAAALKQVPTLEYNPFEAIKTNIIGTQNVINAAIDKKVKKVVLISTDKAAQPNNLYGSTKLCGEKLFVSGNSYSGIKTQFSCVRYGNVIGSRGSIIEILMKNRNAKKVSITDERMTRFWITLPEALELVLFALKNMVGGEIFIPRVASMKLVDLFETIVPNVPREIIGIRSGEKMHEILITEEEARHACKFDKYYVIYPEYSSIFDKERFAKYLGGDVQVPDSFILSSNNNETWFTQEELKKILKI